MSKYRFGFIGCGNMGGALANAAAASIPAAQLAVSDADEQKTAALAKAGKATAATVAEVAAESAYIFIAVKPQGLEGLFREIRPLLDARRDRFVLVSMAAGTSIARVKELAGDHPVIRIMPNTPVRVGAGMTVYAADGATEEEIGGFLSGLAAAGTFDSLPERLIDAAGALSGCGPAFVYLFAEALADAGVECGLPREQALLYAAQTLEGSAKMILTTHEHPARLKDAVCSPGGTTIAGVHALEEGAFRGTVMAAVHAAFEKTAKLK